jgi:hypothetical protein
MRTSNSDRLTAATTEQLLDGGPGPAGLHQLLAAAAGPGTASELAGETAAVAAFADAPRENPLPSAPIRRPSMLSTALSKILAAKALAAVVLLAGATGGVALAANSTSAPSSSTDETSVTSAPTADDEPADDEDAAASDSDTDANSDEPDAAKAPSPGPSILGLCKAWSAGATDNPGKAAESPAFRSLVEAAGSTEDVPGYCAVQESTEQRGKSATADEDPDAATTDGPGNSANQGGPPTAAPGNPDRPTGPPADRATKNGDTADGDTADSDTADSDAQDAEDGDDSQGGGAQSKQGGQGGGASADHRPTN